MKYGDSNTKEIKMIPDENYELVKITVNGQNYSFEKAADDLSACFPDSRKPQPYKRLGFLQ